MTTPAPGQVTFDPGDPSQFDTIKTRDWYTAMRLQAQAIMVAMQTDGFGARDSSSWIKTAVQGIYVEFALNDAGTMIVLRAGQNADRSAMFTWNVPLGWVTT